jgi:hypothetical protein
MVIKILLTIGVEVEIMYGNNLNKDFKIEA